MALYLVLASLNYRAYAYRYVHNSHSRSRATRFAACAALIGLLFWMALDTRQMASARVPQWLAGRRAKRGRGYYRVATVLLYMYMGH